MIKKLLVFLIALTVICGGISPQFIASAEQSYQSNEAAEHLKNMGILPQSFDGDEMIKRGEFAELVYNLAGRGKISGKAPEYNGFSPEGLSKAIGYCSQNGYMNGDDDGFREGDPITYAEALTVMVRVLNYTEYARVKGDYSVGYYKTADYIGLTKGVGAITTDSNLSFGNTAVILYNTLKSKAYKIDKIGDGSYQYNVSDTVFAYDALGLSISEGIMTSNGYADISGGENTDKNTIVIANNRYRTGGTDETFRFYLGQEVSIFYDDDVNAVSVAPTGRSNILQIPREDFSGYRDNKIDYYSGDKKLTAGVSAKAVFVKNGEVVMDFKSTDFENAEYADIVLIDSAGDREYKYVIVNIYETFTVYGRGNDGVVTSANHANSIDLDDKDKEVLIYDSLGRRGSADDIEKDYVISAITGKNFIYAVYANTMTNGRIEKIGNDSITVDGMNIRLPYGSAGKLTDVSAGDYATLYFDFMGRLVSASKGAEDSLSIPRGYLIDAKVKDGLSSTLKLKIFTSKGEMKVYETADRVSIDGNRCNADSLSDVPSALTSGGEVRNVIVLYELNIDGKITSITTPKTHLSSNEDGFIQSTVKEKARVISNGTLTNTTAKSDKTYFSGKEFVNANTEIFVVPEDLSDEDGFLVNSRSQLPISTTFTWDTYHLSKNNGYIDIAVIYGNIAKSEYDNALSVVKEVCQTLDAEGNQTSAIKVYTAGEETSAIVKDGFTLQEYKIDKSGNKTRSSISFNELKPGDVVRLASDSKGYLKWGERVYEAATATFKGSVGSGEYATYSLYVTAGYAAYNDSTLMRLSDDKAAAYTFDSDIFKLNGYIYSSAKIMVVEDGSKEIKVTSGSPNDISIGDYVIYQSRSGVGAHLIVLKNK